MRLRSAARADIDAILDFWRSAATVPSSTDDAESIAALLERSPDAVIIAEDGSGRIVGTVIAGFDGWRGAMYRVAVHPATRRRGVATALVAEGERRLIAQGAVRLHMIVNVDEEPAQAFWASAGYERTDQSRFVKTLPC